MIPAVDALVVAAQAAGGTVVQTPAATIIVIPTRPAADPDELVPLKEAARLAATSVRVLREAIRSGALVALGRQRDRSVRRRDLDAWIETRTAPVARVAETQSSRVELRLLRGKR
jgi:hypothetical protein